jgi:SPP1 gp7 family putative phage head morphogenesis protein
MNWALLSKEERRELAACIDFILDFLLFVPVRKEAGEIEKLEKQLQKVLGRQWNEQTRKAVETAVEQLRQLGEPVTKEKIDMVLKTLEYHLGPGMAASVAERLAVIIIAAYVHGRKEFLPEVSMEVSLNLVDEQAIEMLNRHTVFWIGNYYTEQLGQMIAGKVKELAIEQGLGREDVGQALKALLGKHFNRSDTYWRGLAANTITRARNLGVIEGMVEAEITEYEVVAVMDERTSAICREMNGRIIKVEQAVKLREALLNAKSPEDVKTIAPWLKLEDIRGKPTKDLSIGMAAPPYHFHCRSTIVPRVTVRRESVTIVPEDTPVDYERDKSSKAQEGIRQYLNSLTPYERANKLNALAHNTWPERKARGHLKHTELGITDHKELIRQAKEVVQKPNRILVFFGKDGHLQYAFARGGDDWRIAIVDADMQQIRTFYGPRKDEWTSLEQRVIEGKRSQGWVELVWGNKE